MAHVLQEMSRALDKFWKQFGGRKNSGKNFHAGEKLPTLQKYARLHFVFKQGQARQSIRNRFDLCKEANRNPRHSLKSHKLCFVCLNDGTERHHVIP